MTTEQDTRVGGQDTAPEWASATRPVEGRLVAGVALGLARQFGVDVTLVRLLIVCACLCGGLGLPLYLAGWILMPDEGTGISIANDLAAHAKAHAVARN